MGITAFSEATYIWGANMQLLSRRVEIYYQGTNSYEGLG